MQLKVSCEDARDGITLVRVASDAQIGAGKVRSALELRRVLLQAAADGRLPLVVDLTAAHDIDGYGLSMLVGALKRVYFKGGTAALVVAGEELRTHLSGLGLPADFPIHDTAVSAVSMFVAAHAELSVEQRQAAMEERARERRASEKGVTASGEHTFEHLSEDITLVKVMDGQQRAVLDPYTVAPLRKLLADLVNRGRFYLVVDLTAVEFIDSTGLGMLVGGLKRLRAHDGGMAVVATDDYVLKGFRITGLTKVFPIFDTIDPAVEYLGRMVSEAHV